MPVSTSMGIEKVEAHMIPDPHVSFKRPMSVAGETPTGIVFTQG
jgi:hypothetical protein